MQRSLFDMTVPELKAKAKRAGIRVTKKNGTPKKKAELVKEISRQTGSSNTRADKMRKAKPPGKRKSASGRTYYEYRKNRSDVPPGLTERYNGWANYWTWKLNLEYFDGLVPENLDQMMPNEGSYEYAQVLKDEFEMYIDEYAENEFIKSMLYAISDRVDYREIAEHYLEM